jgi:hypothetical protein
MTLDAVSAALGDARRRGSLSGDDLSVKTDLALGGLCRVMIDLLCSRPVLVVADSLLREISDGSAAQWARHSGRADRCLKLDSGVRQEHG